MGDKRLFTYEELQDHAATVQKVALDNGRAEGRADEREKIVTLLEGLKLYGRSEKTHWNAAIDTAIAAIKSTEDVCPDYGFDGRIRPPRSTEDDQPGPYAKVFRERVCPVPEFPGIKKEES